MSESTSGPGTAPLFLEPVDVVVPALPTHRESTEASDAAQSAATPPPVLAPLLALRDGVPSVVDDDVALAAAAAALAAGHGPLAVDAERASSYRYGHRAYLVQLRREGSGLILIDPISCPDLSSIGAAVGDAEWIVHAANQDLPCLADVGMAPPSLFDTELAGRLAGYPRVGLATMVESLLGWRMEKDHSAADWSRRPLPEPWLRYAALDVELLIELRDVLEAELERQGKLAWAREEFEHVRTAPPTVVAADRWRRLSGIHKVRQRRQLAVARAMWLTRDRIASENDISPSRLLPDVSILHVVTDTPASAAELGSSGEFHGRGARRHLDEWWAAITEALAVPESEWPPIARTSDGPPPAHRWAERDRAAADRLGAARAALAALSAAHTMPTENLLQPDTVRRLAWQPPAPLDVTSVTGVLRSLGAREWQIQLTAEPLTNALAGAVEAPQPAPRLPAV